MGKETEPHTVGLQGRKGLGRGLGWRSRWTPGAVGTDRAAAALGSLGDSAGRQGKRKRGNFLKTAKTRIN